LKRARTADREQMLDMVAWRVGDTVVKWTKDCCSNDRPNKPTWQTAKHGFHPRADFSFSTHA
jgi:hypothetical protein